MAKILIGVATYKPDPRFLESLSQFVKSVLLHELEVYTVKQKPLVDAQNQIAEYFLKGTWQYLLMLEDDHWGHTPEMLESLLKPNAHMVAIKYYSRHYPYICCLLKEGIRKPKYKDIEQVYSNYPISTKGYKPCTLVGFGMTLIKRDVFYRLEKTFFRINRKKPITQGDGTVKVSYATDRDFCNRLLKNGMNVLGCFDHCLWHNGIHEDNLITERCKKTQSTEERVVNRMWKKFKEKGNNQNQPKGVSYAKLCK